MVDASGDHEFLFHTMEDCVGYFQPHLGPDDVVKTVDVCSQDCCSYTEQYGLSSDQCHDDCEVTPPIVPECEMASIYYHPPTDMKPYW